MTNEQQLPEPTRCYVDGCDRENELMLHAANDPWLGGDYCLGHAREIVASTPLIMTCECPICGQARRVLPDDRHQETLTGPGRWLVITETSSYDLDLEDGVTGTLVRRLGTGQGVAQERSTCHLQSPLNCAETVRSFPCIGRRGRWSGSRGR